MEICFRTPDSATPSKVGLVEMFPSGPPNRRKSLTPQQDSFDNASDDEFMDGGSCTALYDFDGKYGCFHFKCKTKHKSALFEVVCFSRGLILFLLCIRLRIYFTCSDHQLPWSLG